MNTKNIHNKGTQMKLIRTWSYYPYWSTSSSNTLNQPGWEGWSSQCEPFCKNLPHIRRRVTATLRSTVATSVRLESNFLDSACLFTMSLKVFSNWSPEVTQEWAPHGRRKGCVAGPTKQLALGHIDRWPGPTLQSAAQHEGQPDNSSQGLHHLYTPYLTQHLHQCLRPASGGLKKKVREPGVPCCTPLSELIWPSGCHNSGWDW